jgi:hypothetical protein
VKQQNRKIREDVRNLPLKVKAEMASKETVAETLAEHKCLGNPIAVWRNGKAVWIPSEEIVVPEGNNAINRQGRRRNDYSVDSEQF